MSDLTPTAPLVSFEIATKNPFVTPVVSCRQAFTPLTLSHPWLDTDTSQSTTATPAALSSISCEIAGLFHGFLTRDISLDVVAAVISPLSRFTSVAKDPAFAS